MPFTKENAAQLGRKGGQATAKKYGKKYMKRIAKKGFWSRVNKHFNGNARAYTNWFIAVGLAAADPMPYNGAFLSDPILIKQKALSGTLNRLPRRWRPPRYPADLEPPF